jgi:hypothetical protein
MCLFNVNLASSKKGTSFIYFFSNPEPPQHFSSVLHVVLLCVTFDIFVFTILVVVFFPWRLLCKSVAHELHLTEYISQVQWDHLHTMCSSRDNRASIPTVQVTAVTTSWWWDNYAHTSWVCICLCLGDVINLPLCNLKLIHCYTMHISYYRLK